MLDNAAMSKSSPSELTGVEKAELARLRALLEAAPRGVQADVAKRSGTSSGYVHQLAKGHRPLNVKMAVAFAGALGIHVREISPRLALEVDGLVLGSSPEPIRVARYPAKVQGVLFMDDDGYCAPDNVKPLSGVVPWSGPFSVLAWQVFGDSLAPRYAAGSFILAGDHPAPEPTDNVLITMKDGRLLIAELAGQRDGIVTLRRIRDDGRMTVAADEITSMKLIAGTVHRALFTPD